MSRAVCSGGCSARTHDDEGFWFCESIGVRDADDSALQHDLVRQDGILHFHW